MIKSYYLFNDIYDDPIKDFALFSESVAGDDALIIHITSYGGDAFAAIAAINIIEKLRSKGVDVKADVMGMCASAATMIALSCNIIDMRSNAVMMFHSAFGPDDEIVKRVNDEQAKLLRNRGIGEDYIKSLLSDDPSYIYPDQAKDLGLCDNVIQSGVDDMRTAQTAACIQRKMRFRMENENEWKEKKEEEVLDEDDKKTSCEGEDLLGMIEGLTKAIEEIRERIDRLESRGDDRDDDLDKKIDEVIDARAKKVQARIASLCGGVEKKKKLSEKYSAKADLERSKSLYGKVKVKE